MNNREQNVRTRRVNYGPNEETQFNTNKFNSLFLGQCEKWRDGEWEEEKVCKQCLSNRNFRLTDKHIFESIDLAQIGLWSMWMKQWKRNDVNWKKNWHFKTKSINKSQNVCTQRRMQGRCARERSKANIDINHNAYELIHFCFHRRCPTRRIHSKFEIWHYIYRSGQFNVKTSWNWPIECY